MIIKSIELQNFRNYEYESIEFDEKTNILYGDNAQGKTNVLEAVFISGTNKSHKGSKDMELINFNSNEAHIKAVISKRDIDYRIDMHLRKSKSKGIAINGIPIRRSSELYGLVNIIFFSPEDLNIIKSGPSARRRFIDMELCQLDKIYVDNLIKYNKTLEQRNKLLKDIYFNPSLEDTLDIWNSNLVKYGSEIIKRRRIFIEKLNSIIENIHYKLSGNKEHLVISYEESVNEDKFLQELNDNIGRDKKTKMTGCGPHRDDISFLIGDVDIRKYGSQGQQRTTALSLKLAEIELVRQSIGDSPVLLLDDVLSELDSNRQNYLLNSINDVQTIITCTGLDEFISNRFNINRIFKVTEGHVSKEN
jgi:DNA replication and repair protein RecF